MARKPDGWDRWSPEKRAAHTRSLKTRRARHARIKSEQMAQEAAQMEAEGAFDPEEIERRNREYLAENGDSARAKQGLGKKTTANTIRASDNLTAAFDLMGGVPAFVKWGRKNQTEFYRIWARLIPKEAVDTSMAMPLETLLEQLATKSEKTVAEAAYEIGEETLAAAALEVEIEDARAAFVRDEEGSVH